MLRSLTEYSNQLIHLTASKYMFLRHYAVGAKIIGGKTDKSFVAEDAEKLATHVCINYFVQGGCVPIFVLLSYLISNFSGEEPGPKILPDSEYPSWLFELDLRPPRELEDLDPEKDGWLYWRALRKRQFEQHRRNSRLRTKFLHLQTNPNTKQKK